MVAGAPLNCVSRTATLSFVVLSLCISLAAVEKQPLQEYKLRRELLAKKVGSGAIVLFGNPDQDLVKFHQEANFLYLTGFDEPDTILIIDCSSEPIHEYFFLKPRDVSQERWTGAKIGPGSEAIGLLRVYKKFCRWPNLPMSCG